MAGFAYDGPVPPFVELDYRHNMRIDVYKLFRPGAGRIFVLVLFIGHITLTAGMKPSSLGGLSCSNEKALSMITAASSRTLSDGCCFICQIR